MKREIGFILVGTMVLSLSGCRLIANNTVNSNSGLTDMLNNPTYSTQADYEPDSAGVYTYEDLLSSEESAEDSYSLDYTSDEVQNVINSLQTDYSKINWGVTYSPSEDCPGIVFSIAPFYDGYYWYLVLGITNCYDQPVTIEAEGYAKNEAGDNIGSTYIYANTIGSRNTYVGLINCTDVPTGEIRWDSVSINVSEGEYVPWESEWSLTSNDDGTAAMPIMLSSVDGSEMNVGEITAVVINSNGNVIGFSNTYSYDYTSAYVGTISFPSDNFGNTVADVAVFANPTK